MNTDFLDHREYTSCFSHLADTVKWLSQSCTQTSSPLSSLTRMARIQIFAFQISSESRKGFRTLFGP